MNYHILLVKESVPGEKRVSLTPEDLKILIKQNHQVYVEAGAGADAGFSDDAYQSCGAEIRQNNEDYSALFAGINLICRAKRPIRARELAEAKALIV